MCARSLPVYFSGGEARSTVEGGGSVERRPSGPGLRRRWVSAAWDTEAGSESRRKNKAERGGSVGLSESGNAAHRPLSRPPTLRSDSHRRFSSSGA